MKESLIEDLADQMDLMGLIDSEIVSRPKATTLEKKYVPPVLYIRSTKTFLFCKECLKLMASELEVTPATIISCFFCPSCQSGAQGKFKKVQRVMDSLKKASEEVLIKELKGRRNNFSEEQVREAILKVKKEYEEWSDTQALTGSAYLFPVEDVIAVFTEVQVREFMPSGDEVNKFLFSSPTKTNVPGVPVDPRQALVRQLFLSLHDERIAHNENLEEHIINKGF